MPLTPGLRYWAPHQEHVFVPGLFVGQDAGGAAFRDADGETFQVPADAAAGLNLVSEKQLEGVDNVCSLEEVTNAAVMHTVRTRFLKSPAVVYTRVARIMIAVNPFQSLPIYSASTMKRYLEAGDAMYLEPHIFAIGSDAIRGLRGEGRRNQAVLISGESGAGKTESTKLILSYMSAALVGSCGGIQDKIMQTNPILESFGNAMTVRNNNSSRFGKWLQIIVNDSCAIQGCSVVDYLLELTRVCKQGPKERGYHVFFQILQAKDFLPDCPIHAPQDYSYIKDSQHVAPHIDDRQCFEELTTAFGTLGFSEEAQRSIFRIVLGILTLGNADFAQDGEGSRLKDDAPVSEAAALFGIATEPLKKCLTTKLIKVVGDHTETGRSAAQAEQARDGLARLLYGRVFKHLIQEINRVLSQGSPLTGQFFGVLDIAGFESFEKNSLEQLFINLSNEYLQAHFNNHIFRMELDDYKAEGIDAATSLSYQDNSDIIALLDSKASLLASLDEEVSVPKPSDDNFTAKIVRTFAQHPRFFSPKIAQGLKFGVRHFAGDVLYSADGFVDKNVDRPPEEAPEMLLASSNDVLRSIGSTIDLEIKEASAPGKRRMKTVSSGFRASLAALMATLSQAEPNFVRCIKPNQEKMPGKLSTPMVFEQLTCAGVFEAVRIRQSGYASRVLFQDFVARYRSILPKAKAAELRRAASNGKSDVDCAKMFVALLPDALAHLGGFDPRDIVLGTSKVFSRTKLVGLLDKAREIALTTHVIDIQRVYRGYRARHSMKELKVVFGKVKEWHRAHNFYAAPGPEHTAVHALRTAEGIDASLAELEPLLDSAVKMPLACPNLQAIQDIRRRMHNEAEAVRGAAAAAMSLEPMVVEKAILRCEDLDIAVPEVELLRSRLAALRVQIPLVKGAETAMEEQDEEGMAEVLAAVEDAGLSREPEKWLPELRGAELMRHLARMLADGGSEACAAEGAEPPPGDVAAPEGQMADRQGAEEEPAAATAATGAVAGAAAAGAAGAAAPRASAALLSVGHAKSRASAQHRGTMMRASTKRKVSIAGLSEEDETRILLDLLAAMEVCDVGRLEAGLNEATKQGVPQGKHAMTSAWEMYRNLSSEEWLRKALEERTEELQSTSTQGVALRSLQNIIRQAESLQVAPAAVAVAKRRVQEKVRIRARTTLAGKVFEEVDIAEMEMVDGSFSNLADFPGLKSPNEWRGHRAPSFFSFGASGPEVMLVHQKQDLKDPLTQVPSGLEAQCVDAYTNILGWMYDRPVPEIQRVGLLQDILGTARHDQFLADEIYCQVMKQLTQNPSARSQLQGWKLMHNLCQAVCPTTGLHEFVHSFLMRAIRRTEDHEVMETIKECVTDLNVTSAPEQSDADDIVSLQVMLIDSSMRRVRVQESSTLKQLVEIMASQLKISAAVDFAFFQVTDGHDAHRLLPDTTVISALLHKWQQLQEATGRGSKLLFKRKFLRVDEFLHPGDLAHANLTYRQAVWDFLRYPVDEDTKLLLDISSRIVWVERDYFAEYVSEGTLDSEGVLEQVVSDTVLRGRNRSKVAQHILDQYRRLSENLDPTEHRLVTMSRVLSLMQRLRLFGSFYWLSREIFDVPAEKVSIPDAPKAICRIDFQAGDPEYYVVVDYFGVRFVRTTGTAHGSPIRKSFYFSEDASERVVQWGAVQNILQMTVTAINPAQPQGGAVPMSIAVVSTAAVDVSYAMHVVHSMRGLSKRHPAAAGVGQAAAGR